jgi:hypothetical protein
MPEVDPRIEVIGDPAGARTQAACVLAEIAGATAVAVSPAAARLEGRAAVLVTAEIQPGAAEGLRGRLARLPVLVLGLRSDTVAAVGAGSSLGASVTSRRYRMLGLWPFAGLELQEETDRVLATIAGEGLQPIVLSEERPVIAKAAGGRVLLAAGGDWPGGVPHLLRSGFCPGRFLDALPVLVFVRDALGPAAWTRAGLLATIVVDDPNLAGFRYGHLDFRIAAANARKVDFHLSLGFVPLDYRKTAPAVADFFRRHDDVLSLVMHGIDHLSRELARPADAAVCANRVRTALARVRDHEARTALSCPAVMTMPHGASTPEWIRALSEAGYHAAYSGRAYAFTDDAQAAGAPRDYELRPAELSLAGFPMLKRWSLDHPHDDLLFGAFLGQPTILYTHHNHFAKGWDSFIAEIDFVNRQVRPRWTNSLDLVRSNWLRRRVGGRTEVRAYANQVVVDAGERVLVSKHGAGIPPAPVVVNGVEAQRSASDRLREVELPMGRYLVDFAPLTNLAPSAWRRALLSSRVRRSVAEARDRLAGALG